VRMSIHRKRGRSLSTARDRDRLRQDVLEDLGRRICRVWSTDWARNRETQISRGVSRPRECPQRGSPLPPALSGA
jgi:hypothetical protein